MRRRLGCRNRRCTEQRAGRAIDLLQHCSRLYQSKYVCLRIDCTATRWRRTAPQYSEKLQWCHTLESNASEHLLRFYSSTASRIPPSCQPARWKHCPASDHLVSSHFSRKSAVMHLQWRWILFFLATCSLVAASNWSKEDYEVSPLFRACMIQGRGRFARMRQRLTTRS